MQIADKVFVVTGGGNGSAARSSWNCSTAARGSPPSTSARDGLAETAALAPVGRRPADHPRPRHQPGGGRGAPRRRLAAHGQVDGLVNVAGIVQRFVRVADSSFDQIERVLAVNFWGVVHTCKVFLPAPRGPPRGEPRQRLEHGRAGAGARSTLRREQGRGEAAHRGRSTPSFATPSVAVTVVFPGGSAPTSSPTRASRSPAWTAPADLAAS